VALRSLESEGVVTYEANRGYVIDRLGEEDLAQILPVRGLLEADLLRTIERPGPEVLSRLKALNDAMIAAIEARDVAGILRANREFHFVIFELSPLNQLRHDVERLWQPSEGTAPNGGGGYSTPRTRINAEHKSIIAALRKFDLDRLVELSETHRTGGFERTVAGVTRVLASV
jgi:DNA-binding GntR family transcriptional regulator